MPNYKLTTDLITDCMALIPDNLELLNDHGFYFEKVDSFYEVELPSASNCRLSFYDARQAELSFIIASHCLRTIPEFQVERQEYIQDSFLLNLLEKRFNDGEIADYSLVATMESSVEKTPKTIASATLHGMEYKVIDGKRQLVMMDKPPSTLEKLCESYKNVMSK
jgi:hypothetical protein